MWHCKGWHPLAVFLYSKDLEHLRICLWIPWKTNSKMHLKMAQKGRPLFVFHLLYHPSIFFWTILGFCCSVSGRVFSILKNCLDQFLFMCPPVCHSLEEFGSVSLRDNGCCSWNIFQATSEPIQEKRRQSLSLVILLKSTNVDELYSFGYQLCICIKNIESINKTHSTSAPWKMYIMIQLSLLSLHQSLKSYK